MSFVRLEGLWIGCLADVVVDVLTEEVLVFYGDLHGVSFIFMTLIDDGDEERKPFRDDLMRGLDLREFDVVCRHHLRFQFSGCFFL